jgi:hypothetical protein
MNFPIIGNNQKIQNIRRKKENQFFQKFLIEYNCFLNLIYLDTFNSETT